MFGQRYVGENAVLLYGRYVLDGAVGGVAGDRAWAQMPTEAAPEEQIEHRQVLCYLRGRHEQVAARELLFGDPWASAYRVGPHPELIGRRVGTTSVASAPSTIANARLLDDVEPSKQIVPTRVTGRIRDGSPTTMRDLAVAVNGRIAAVGRSFHLDGRTTEFFSLIVPESALRRGHNVVELLEVQPGGGLRALACSAARSGRGPAWPASCERR